VATNFIK